MIRRFEEGDAQAVVERLDTIEPPFAASARGVVHAVRSDPPRARAA